MKFIIPLVVTAVHLCLWWPATEYMLNLRPALNISPTGVPLGRKRRSGCELPSAGSPSRGGWGRSNTREALAAVTWSRTVTTMRRRARRPSAWQLSRANTKEEGAWEVRGGEISYNWNHFVWFCKFFSWSHWDVNNILFYFVHHRPNTEERARIYSSDSDEGSDDDRAQRLMKAKKLDSDEVGVVICWTDRGQCHVGHCSGKEGGKATSHISFIYSGQEILVL